MTEGHSGGVMTHNEDGGGGAAAQTCGLAGVDFACRHAYSRAHAQTQTHGTVCVSQSLPLR